MTVETTPRSALMETVRVRLQLALMIVQVLAIVFGGIAMLQEVRGVVDDVKDLKVDVRELRDANAGLLVIHRDIEYLTERVERLEERTER